MDLTGVSILCFAASYAVVFGLEVWQFRQPQRRLRWLIRLAALAGLGSHAIYLALHASPFRGASSTLLLVSFILALFYFSGTWHYRRFIWGIFVLPLIEILILVAWLENTWLRHEPDIQHTAALDAWTWCHVALLVLGYVGLCVAGLTSAMYLVQAWRVRHKINPTDGRQLLSLERLDTMHRRALLLSFPFLTSGIFVGILIMPAYQLAWFDLKVLASLALWGLLLGLLVLRHALHWRGRRMAWGTMTALCLLFGVFAVSRFFPSAHPTSGMRRS